MNITLDKQIPVSRARNNFSQLLNTLSQDKVYLLVKNYIPKAVMVDPVYFKKLQEQARWQKIDEALNFASKEFNGFLEKRGLAPEKVKEKTVNQILFQ